MTEQVFIDDDEMIISKEQMKYYFKLMKFKNAHSELWEEWVNKVSDDE